MAYEEAALDALEKMAQEYDEKNKVPKSNLLVRFFHGLLCSDSNNNDSDEDYSGNKSFSFLGYAEEQRKLLTSCNPYNSVEMYDYD